MKKGFTLIELLVAFAIIGVLASIVVFSSNSALKRSRDAQRKSDLKNIADAFELFYNDHGVYPLSGAYSLITACPYDSQVPQNSTNCVWGEGIMSDDRGTVYMTQLPKDPRSNVNYRYMYLVSPARDQYKIFALLENPEDPNIDSVAIGQDVDCTVGGLLNRCNYAITSQETTVDATW